ncbi:type II secretion system F family protein [Oscillibacter sp.]|uniref:type II secretion system F family protein n=1 Tax=Oscillibacter sp. TaxID=1945593 RepID=UPI0026224494|nr:type II secretion system F family protein [Oscillibacter sp.]MDD3347410.1 type II secretion system F family protein [Oscillibacter sp.]
MASFSYIVLTPAGKERKGTLESESRETAAAALKKDGDTLISLNEAGALSKNLELGFFKGRPKPRDMAVFCRQFVSIVSAGVTVTTALEMLSDQTENRALSAAISGCRMAIQAGASLSDSMRDYPRIFSSLFVTMVAAGEVSGSLDVSFTRMADHFEKDAKLKGLVKKASIYPIVVCVVAVVVVMVLLTFVIPTFESMLTDLGVELPAVTKFVLGASKFMQGYWWLVLLLIAGLVAGIKYARGTEGGQHLFGRLGLKLPVIGKLTVKTASARMSRTLSTLLAAGIPLIDALEITANTMTNVYFRDALLSAKEDVGMGEPLSQTLLRSSLFPSLVHHMIGIGEETGDLDHMLNRLADYYDEEVELSTQQVMALIEPMIIVFLALVVGTIVFAVIMPMGSMYSGLDNL